MKTISILVAGFASLLALSVQAADNGDELERLAAMRQAVEDDGIGALLEITRVNGWRAPQIPSQWHVEHVSSSEQRPVDAAARALGKAIVVRLVEVAKDLQQLPQNDELYRVTSNLCDLADWIWGIEGYGNLFLVNRLFDLSYVGTARLTANLDFPLEKCQELSARFREPWEDAAVRVRILNAEAGARIFLSNDPDEMERTWGTGRLYHMEQFEPDLREKLDITNPDAQLRETPAMRDNLEFFEDLEARLVKPFTLATTWDLKHHIALVRGLFVGGFNRNWTQQLLEFRVAVGEFPEHPVEPILSARQKELNEKKERYHEEHGIRVVPDSRPPQERAFMQAWEALGRTPDTSFEEWQQRRLVGAGAWTTYQKVLNGEFLDWDTQQNQAWQREQEGLRQRDAAGQNNGGP